MLKRTYQRLLALAASRNAPWWLALVAFAEAKQAIVDKHANELIADRTMEQRGNH